MSKVAVFVGTRPEIIKMQPVMKALSDKRKSLNTILVHTGQHYDANMSDTIMEDVGLPRPDIFLGVGSATQGVQTAKIISRVEEVLMKERPDLVLVLGDTNSVLGTALAASKLRIVVGHVEAGCRSHDPTMTEELNRMVVSDLGSLHFAPTKNCRSNLIREGISREAIHLVGHPLVDLLTPIMERIDSLPGGFGYLTSRQFCFSTLHREENVDGKGTLKSILAGLQKVSRQLPLVIALHPRTAKRIREWELQRYLDGVIVKGPVSYLESLELIRNARIVLTDSGGIQQEAYLLSTPCLTLRDRTEWIETVEAGVNFLSSPQEIPENAKRISEHFDAIEKRFESSGNAFGRPSVSKRIVEIVESVVAK